MNKKYGLGIISIIVVIIIIVLLNYDNILKWRYNKAVKNKDCEKIYSIVDIEKGKYLTKEKYIEQCKLKINGYTNYDIILENHKIKDNLVNVYNNIVFYIPSDSNFYLDNKLVSSNFVSDENNIYNIYTFNKLFEGEYSISFNNTTKEEKNKITISQDDLKTIYEYHSAKQAVVIIGNNLCSHCTDLVNFLATLDIKIFDTKFYDIYTNNSIEYKEIERLKQEFSNHFKTPIEYFPTVIIGNKYIVGFGDDMRKEYIDSIYHSYRNEVETVIE